MIEEQSNLDPLIVKMFNETISAPGTKEEVLTLLLSMVYTLQKQIEESTSTTASSPPMTPPAMDCADIGQYKIRPDDSKTEVRKKQGKIFF
jgi:hypothetical protein